MLDRLRLAAPGDVTGEKGNGESEEDEGECESGVLPSEKLLLLVRRTWDAGRGIGTPFVGRVAGKCSTELVGDEVLDEYAEDCGRWWVA